MTALDKATSGALYDANYDADLLALRLRAKIKLHEFNTMSPADPEARNCVLKSLLGRVGEAFFAEGPFYCDYGHNIEIGDHFYANVNLVILDGAKVTIGDYVFIAPNVGLYTAGHPLDKERRNQGLEYALPITIGNNVWIGAGVSVLPGVTIGDDAVIGAGSVVTRSIPPGVLAAGNPCRVLREITEADRQRQVFA